MFPAFKILVFKEFIKSLWHVIAGTRIYSLQPFLKANSLYSISSSTKVSECSDTNAIGTKTMCFPSLEFSTIISSVDGPIHFNGPTRLW